MRERLIRVFLLGLAALLAITLAKGVADWQNKSKVAGASIDFQPIGEKLEEVGEDILGKATSLLPGAPELGKENQTSQETEPIEEPVKNVEKQTEILIQAIKELPQDQIEAIKKQIYKEICEGILGEE